MRELAFGKCSRSNPWLTRLPCHGAGLARRRGEPEAGRIEATDTTLRFGIKDDIVIRVQPLKAGSVVDVCSLSRIGGNDIGTNARRVRAFGRRLAAG
jgi:uncharacterized protein (DUF1499 family)